MLWVEGNFRLSRRERERKREIKHQASHHLLYVSMILNPNGAHYTELKAVLKAEYEDLVWSEDVVFLERNSRTFKERSKIINRNTEALCDFLIDHPKGKRCQRKKSKGHGC